MSCKVGKVGVGKVGPTVSSLSLNDGEVVDIVTGVKLGWRVFGVDVDGMNVSDGDGGNEFRSKDGALVVGLVEG